MERKRFIAITPEEGAYLQKLFGVSDVTVWHAVKYNRNNDIHKRIRKAAIERGNIQMAVTPEFDTIFLTNREDADESMTRYMVQNFANGATLEGNLKTGVVTIRNRKGEVAYTYENPQVSELKAMQEVAMKL